MNQRPTTAEQQALATAQASRQRCVCGDGHADGTEITCSAIARMKAYLAAHPNHRFAFDDEAAIFAVVVSPQSGPPTAIVAHASDLTGLLDALNAPPAAELC